MASEFDSKAKNWDANPERTQRALDVARCIGQTVELHSGQRTLEYGCGTGSLGLSLKPKVGELVLADVSEGMLTEVQKKLRQQEMSDATVVHLDLSDPSWKESADLGSFDLVVTMMVLHHVADVDTILSGFSDLVRKGGYLFIADLDTEDGFHGPGSSAQHEGFDRENLARRTESLGFRKISETTAFRIRRNEREFPVFLLGFVKL